MLHPNELKYWITWSIITKTESFEQALSHAKKDQMTRQLLTVPRDQMTRTASKLHHFPKQSQPIFSLLSHKF